MGSNRKLIRKQKKGFISFSIASTSPFSRTLEEGLINLKLAQLKTSTIPSSPSHPALHPCAPPFTLPPCTTSTSDQPLPPGLDIFRLISPIFHHQLIARKNGPE